MIKGLLEKFGVKSFDTENPAVWVISGPTCSGKTTFIDSKRCTEFTGVPVNNNVCVDSIFNGLKAMKLPMYFDYNTLRPFTLSEYFHSEKKWVTLLQDNKPMRVILLLIDEETIKKRFAERTENNISDPEKKYAPFIENINLLSHYNEWLVELRRVKTPYILLDARTSEYNEVESLEAFFI